jgi:DNA-binding NtrC family response regulator
MLTRETQAGSGEAPVLIGESQLIRELRAEIARTSRSLAKVLILGETGVGKEVVARLVHAASPRATRAFVAVNCSGIPETLLASELFGHARGSFTGAYRDKVGLVRQADRGTLFLDELGEMSLAMQAMLLRFTETGEVQPVGADAAIGRTDVRLITATNRDLWEQVTADAFRRDLYYRLNVIQIRIPPLRERGGDILLLLQHYFKRASLAHALAVPELAADAQDLLLGYAWPGNVRELRNLTERLVLRGLERAVTADDLRAELQPDGGPPMAAPRQAHESTPRSVPTAEIPPPHAGSPHRVTPTVERLWNRLMAGEDFWTVIQAPFRAHEITRSELVAIIDCGLRYTRGSYRALIRAFNLPPADYKRFHSFLYQQNANLPVGSYRHAAPAGALPPTSAARQAVG